MAPPEQRAFPWIAGLLCVLYVLPVQLAAHLPMQDIPNHLAIVETLAHRHQDPAWPRSFTANLAPQPYVGYYALTLALAKPLGTEAANRLVLTFYVVALLAGAGFLLASSGRGGRWALLLVLPFVYSDAYLVGLTNFLLGLPPLLFGAGLCARLGSGRLRAGTGAVGLGACGLLLYLTHPLTLGVLLLLAGAVVVGGGGSWRRRLAWGSALLPAAALLAAFAVRSAGFGQAPVWLSPGLKAEYLLRAPLLFVDAVGGPLFGICAVLFGALLVAGLARFIARVRREGFGERGPALAAGALLAGYAAAPAVLGSTVWLDARLALLFWLALLHALRRCLLRSRAEKLAAVALAVACGSGVLAGHQRFSTEIEPLFEVLAEAPPGARLLAVALASESQALEPFYVGSGEVPWFSLYAQAGSYYHLHHGGISPFMTFYAGLPWVPLRLRDELYEKGFSIADPFVPARLLGRLPALAGEFDLVLVRGMTEQVRDFLLPLAAPVAQRGPFTLWVMRHRLPPPAPPAPDPVPG